METAGIALLDGRVPEGCEGGFAAEGSFAGDADGKGMQAAEGWQMEIVRFW